jgi:hypothetical protein
VRGPVRAVAETDRHSCYIATFGVDSIVLQRYSRVERVTGIEPHCQLGKPTGTRHPRSVARSDVVVSDLS